MINLVWAYYPFDVCRSVVIAPVSFLISVICVFFFFVSLATGLTISLIFAKNQLLVLPVFSVAFLFIDICSSLSYCLPFVCVMFTFLCS